jgi:ABC-type cobalamin/Fe3+-siderophores transport system ATPase subunit
VFDIELTVKNYRCVGDEPVRIRIADGFTALLGVNNSGKSSLLRIPYELRYLFQFLANTTANGSILNELLVDRASMKNRWGSVQLAPGERIFRAGANKPIEIEIIVHGSPRFAVGGVLPRLSFTWGPQADPSLVLKDERGKIIDLPKPQAGALYNLQPFIDAIRVLSDTMYVGPFRNAINVGGQGQYYDIQIGDSFVSTFAAYKSGPSPEQNEAVVRLMAEIKRIFGFRSLDINPMQDGKTLQITVDDRSYRLSEQGAGLAHFIVVLVNVLVKRPSLLLIDEPELNLHASLQLDFLQTLASYTSHGVVFATHSLGLARTAADRIYTVTKPPGGTTTVRPYDEGRELVTLLGQLSFDRRPELGFSKVLLVEGKTELRALMALLRLYGKEHQVLMLPLHGGDMIGGDVGNELTEILRIGGDVQYLIDSERKTATELLEQRRQDFVDLCAKLGIKGHVLERRALENYFTQEAIERACGSKAKVLTPYQKKGADQAWSKTGNWRIAGFMSKADLRGTDLDAFLAQL